MNLHRSLIVASFAILFTIVGCGDDELRKKGSTDRSGTSSAENSTKDENSNAGSNDTGGSNNVSSESSAAGSEDESSNESSAGGSEDESSNESSAGGSTDESSNENNTETTVNTDNNQDIQCAQALEGCTLGEPTNPGFKCDDVGRGPTCYTLCPPSAGEEEPCALGEACVGDVCFPSECDGLLDYESCDGTLDAREAPHGAMCFGGPNNHFRCIPAADSNVGDACSGSSDCPIGAICGNSECLAICTSPADCVQQGRDYCYGLSDSDFLGVDVGLCYGQPPGG